MEDINTILNRTANIKTELNDFVQYMQNDKEGRRLSYDAIKEIFLFDKIINLEKEIYKLKNPNI